jgi:hypothetical protein
MARHHQLMTRLLDKAFARDPRFRRVMMFLPPGAAKSTYTSVYGPPYAIGKYDGIKVIAASHTQDLADVFGRQCRNMALDERWSQAWGKRIDSRSSAASRWDVSAPGRPSSWGAIGSASFLCLPCCPPGGP